ncbi:hypothetical protein F2Q69_00021809 [Brassica cretica]|uniref:Uncharacterized protein n=1 Tax=Brassica cretica TaxID=69181 RepID=A0A8S9Q3P1_BRACR|nr:hypothetical protein F2Q69_00021809 [Brassica cretica]
MGKVTRVETVVALGRGGWSLLTIETSSRLILFSMFLGIDSVLTSFDPNTVRNHHPLDPYGFARAIDGHALQVSREDITYILQMANGADNLFIKQCTVPARQQRVTKEFYDTAGGIENRFKQKYRHPTRPSVDVDIPPLIDRRPSIDRQTDDQGCARDVDEHIINVSKDDIRKLMERASRDEHSYICLPEPASSFTQTKLMKLDSVYYPLNDSNSWVSTCMEEMRQDIAKIQHAAGKHRPASIDRHHSTSTDDDPKKSQPMKSQPDFHTRAEIDQLVEEIYRTLETTEHRLDRRCDDIYFPMDLTMKALTSQIEAMQRELVEIQSYIGRRPEASASIDRRNNKSTDIHRQTSVDEATNLGRLVPKVTSDISDTHNHGES